MPIAFFSETLKKAGFRHVFSTRSASEKDIATAIGIPFADVSMAKQVHSARVIDVADGPSEPQEADAIVSRSEHAIAVRTADCVPILVASQASGEVAAIHAGWRGVVSGIVPNAIELLARRVDRSTLIAAIGPCIGSCCFEVGSDVAEKIANATSTSVIAKRVGEKAFVDLRRAVRLQLNRAGLDDAKIEDVAKCTYCEKELFFSYRRDGANAGRLIAAIVPQR
jgi:YfiH family protein